MGKIRYYCDYCDRSFLDDLKARKRHLSGTQHSRLKRQYYLPYRDPKEVYEEENLKTPCRKFFTFNECPFGETCRFSHLSPPELEALRVQVEESKRKVLSSLDEALQKLPPEESVKNWLSVWESKRIANDANPNKPTLNAVSEALLSWELPTALKSYFNLPPSLRTWKLSDIENAQLSDWG